MAVISKHSKQRDAIMEFLHGNGSHPNAHEIYSAIREEIPNVSLGTIYRNLNQLAEAGEIRKIRCTDGPDRFDFRTDDHGHFICSCCGRFYDVPRDLIMIRGDEGTGSPEDSMLPGRADSLEFEITGVCRDCLREKA